MTAKCVFVEPSDVWLFRDARPFAPNERGRAVSLFPPRPQTMQGIIRSLRLAQSGEPYDYQGWSDNLKAEIGEPPKRGQAENLGALRLRGPLIAKREGNGINRFYPLPLDMTQLQNGWYVLAPHPAPDIQTNWQPTSLQPLLPPEGSEPVKFDAGWLCECNLVAYLEGFQTGFHAHPNDDLFLHEPRLGVQIESNVKRPAEGMLFQVEFIRPQAGVGLLVEVDGVTLFDSGLLQIGGEARAGRYEILPMVFDLLHHGRTPKVGGNKVRFKLYFVTPAIFKNGWLPVWLDPRTLVGKWNGVTVKLVAAAVGKPQPIGGRDISKRDKQRPIRRAVPAGSVYFFEAEENPEDIFKAFDGQSVSDLEVDRQIGFGLCYLGGWSNV